MLSDRLEGRSGGWLGWWWVGALGLFLGCSGGAVDYHVRRYFLPGVELASGLAWCGGYLWTVGDRNSHTIYQLSPEGKVLRRLKVEGKALPFDTGYLDFEGVAVDCAAERLFVACEGVRAVLVVDFAGRVLSSFQVQGKDVRRNQGLEGIAYDASEQVLYIGEEGPAAGEKLVHVYTPSGRHLASYRLPVEGRLTGLWVADGYLWAIISSAFRPERRVVCFSLADLPEGGWRLVVDLAKKGYAENYEGLAVDDGGNIFLINDAHSGERTELLRLFRGE